MPLSPQFTKFITAIRIYASHFFTANITLRYIQNTLLVIALSNSIGMRLRTRFDNLIFAGEREADGAFWSADDGFWPMDNASYDMNVYCMTSRHKTERRH